MKATIEEIKQHLKLNNTTLKQLRLKLNGVTAYEVEWENGSYIVMTENQLISKYEWGNL